MKSPSLLRNKPLLLWCITVVVMVKKVKVKRMKVCPSVIKYLSAGAKRSITNQLSGSIRWPVGEIALQTSTGVSRPSSFRDDFRGGASRFVLKLFFW